MTKERGKQPVQRPQKTEISRANRMARLLWSIIWIMLFRPTPRPLHGWRCFLLRCFGATVGKNVRVYQSTRIWAPWNLTLADNSCLGDWVDCYNVAPISLEHGAIVSQYTFLCTASHDTRYRALPLIAAPITIKADAWVTADVFIAPGITIGCRAIVKARSVVMDDVAEDTVVGGHPARYHCVRKMASI